MSTLAVSLLAGAAVSAVAWQALRGVFAHPTLARENIHGRPVPTAGGLVVVLAVLVPTVAVQLVDRAAPDLARRLPAEAFPGWNLTLVAVLGFGLLGLVDDLLGDGGSRGFRGHLGALRRGVLTTGGLKLVGGGVLALHLALVASGGADPRWVVPVDAVLVALAANLANLFDRAPGRVTKVALLAAVALVIAAPTTIEAGATDRSAAGVRQMMHLVADPSLPPVAALFVVGAGLGIVVPELRERLMLGDSGANAVGAALGLAVVMGVSTGARVGVAVALLVLNLASERVSFSRVIAATPGLRHFDQWGRATS